MNIEQKQRLKTEILSNLFNSAPIGIILVSQKGIIVEANPKLSSLFGYSQTEIIGKPLEELLTERFRKYHTKDLSKFMAKPKTREM